MATATEQPEVKEVTETETVETPEVQPEVKEQPKAFDPTSLPTEAHDHFKKQYADHDKYKAMASEYEAVLRNPKFREWYEGLSKPQQAQPQKFEISDEQYAAAMGGDKNQFLNLVVQTARQIAATESAPKIEQMQREVELGKRTSELQRTCDKYSDFMELDGKGLIEPQLAKYPNISFEDAYFLAKRHTFNDDADKRARGIVDGKKRASVEKPAHTPGGRSATVKVKTRLEAMELAADAFRQGREAPNFEFE